MGSNQPEQHTKQHNARLRGILKHDVGAVRASQGPRTSHLPAAVPAHPPRPKPERGELKFDELNIMDTLHPANKDYGHMTIDEPKTPYERRVTAHPKAGGIDPEALINQLANLTIHHETKNHKPGGVEDPIVPATAGFQEARKDHYKEYSSVKDARKLIEKELSEDEHETPPGPSNK